MVSIAELIELEKKQIELLEGIYKEIHKIRKDNSKLLALKKRQLEVEGKLIGEEIIGTGEQSKME